VSVQKDQTVKGVLLAFAAFAAYAWSDASVKLIEGQLSPYQSSFLGAVFCLVGLPFIMKNGDRWGDIVRTTNRPLWLLRFVAQAGGTIGSVTAFTHLSMAEAFALIFLLPSFVTIMSVIFLKEQVGYRRWAAVVIGFIGVMVVLRPGFRELSIGHLGAVFGGLSGAISIVVFRAMGPSEKNISLYGAGVLGTLIVCGALALPGFQAPTAMQWVWLAGYGLLAALAAILTMYAATYILDAGGHHPHHRLRHADADPRAGSRHATAACGWYGCPGRGSDGARGWRRKTLAEAFDWGRRSKRSHSCARHRNQATARPRREICVYLKESSAPKDLGALDSCDEHRNDGGKVTMGLFHPT
jgi:drug/metabolite transporter (DMT)-like permease